MIPFIKYSKKWQLTYSDREQTGSLQGMGSGDRSRGDTKKHKHPLGDDGDVCHLDCVILFAILILLVYTCVITNQIAHVQYVCFIVCQLHLNEKLNEQKRKLRTKWFLQ